MTNRAKDVTDAKGFYQGMKSVLETLAKTPEDPTGNSEMGKFLCFVIHRQNAADISALAQLAFEECSEMMTQKHWLLAKAFEISTGSSSDRLDISMSSHELTPSLCKAAERACATALS